jgi:hypothetical protein
MASTICINFFYNNIEQFYKNYAFTPIHLVVLAPSPHLVPFGKQGILRPLPLDGCLCATPLTLPAIQLQALGWVLPDEMPRLYRRHQGTTLPKSALFLFHHSCVPSSNSFYLI